MQGLFLGIGLSLALNLSGASQSVAVGTYSLTISIQSISARIAHADIAVDTSASAPPGVYYVLVPAKCESLAFLEPLESDSTTTLLSGILPVGQVGGGSVVALSYNGSSPHKTRLGFKDCTLPLMDAVAPRDGLAIVVDTNSLLAAGKNRISADRLLSIDHIEFRGDLVYSSSPPMTSSGPGDLSISAIDLLRTPKIAIFLSDSPHSGIGLGIFLAVGLMPLLIGQTWAFGVPRRHIGRWMTAFAIGDSLIFLAIFVFHSAIMDNIQDLTFRVTSETVVVGSLTFTVKLIITRRSARRTDLAMVAPLESLDQPLLREPDLATSDRREDPATNMGAPIRSDESPPAPGSPTPTSSRGSNRRTSRSRGNPRRR